VKRVTGVDQRGVAAPDAAPIPLEGPAAFEVESEPDNDVRRDLARAIVTRGWGLLELRPVRMSLEDVFLQVTTEETPEEVTGA
jgi:ABC-2 type transport system ATP-binding protein